MLIILDKGTYLHIADSSTSGKCIRNFLQYIILEPIQSLHASAYPHFFVRTLENTIYIYIFQ